MKFFLRVKGKKKYALCFLFGLILTLALPPFYIFAALFAFAPFLLLLNSCQSRKQAFATGWWFGFGFFVAGLYWIANALLIDPLKFAWLIPFAVCGLPAILAICLGLVAVLTYMLPRPGWRRIVIFAGFWLLMEIARSYLFTGFPWNLIGYSWDFSDSFIQIASVTGIWGLSFIAVLFGAMPYVFLQPEISRKQRIIFPAIILAIMAAIFIFGMIRLDGAIMWGRKLQVNLIQANIPQTLKWNPAEAKENFMRHLELTSYTDKKLADNLIVWPESAVPFLLQEQPELLRAITDVMPHGAYLATGGIRLEGNQRENSRYWNSFFVIDDEADILGVYDKSHLVPFGEYVPFRKFLPFIEKVAGGMGDFSVGGGPKTINLPDGIKIGPLICYEIIFPHQVVESENRPDIIVNVTNDGWYGFSTGPYQHFETARMRAVEEGIPVIRAANSGISGAIDRYGRVIARLGLNKKGNLQSEIVLPNRGENYTKTTFGRFGAAAIILIVFISGFFAAFIKKS